MQLDRVRGDARLSVLEIEERNADGRVFFAVALQPSGRNPRMPVAGPYPGETVPMGASSASIGVAEPKPQPTTTLTL
jgi:hypothetical protein